MGTRCPDHWLVLLLTFLTCFLTQLARRFIVWHKRHEKKVIVSLGILAIAMYYHLIKTETNIYHLKGDGIEFSVLFGNESGPKNISTNTNKLRTEIKQTDRNVKLPAPQTGYDLAFRSQNICSSFIQNETTSTYGAYKNVLKKGIKKVKMRAYTDITGTIKLCPIWKVGTTFFKRTFAMNTMSKYKNIANPYEISFLLKYQKTISILNKTKTKTFLFVRDPYQRLQSGYVDKVLAPNPVYWKTLGIPAIKVARRNASQKSLTCGHDLKFNEYVKYVATVYTMPRRKYKKDMHFSTQVSQCKPCEIDYDFIGKLENVNVDAIELFQSLNLNNTVKLLNMNGSELAADDAIRDTTYQPFDPWFQKGLSRCLSRVEVFQRAWQKLQIRGLIGKQTLTLAEDSAKSLTYDTFLSMARNAYKNSTKEERKEIKDNSYLDMYSQVDKADMDTISKVYAEDFKLFNYDSRPIALFGPNNRV